MDEKLKLVSDVHDLLIIDDCYTELGKEAGHTGEELNKKSLAAAEKALIEIDWNKYNVFMSGESTVTDEEKPRNQKP